MSQEHNTAPAGTIVRQEFGADQIMKQVETSATAVAAAERAAIESRYILAKRFPRDWHTVEQRILKECERPGFAESAIYKKPLGKRYNEETRKWEQQYAEGLSVRFTEAAIRCMTNCYESTKAIYSDAEKVIVRVTVMDLESNNTKEWDVTVAKTVERSKEKDGQDTLGQRRNTSGNLVFILAATEDEIVIKTNSLASKARRNCVLQLLPGDIQDACFDLCRRTMEEKDKADPAAAMKQIFAAFYKFGVTPEHLKQYLRLSTDTLQPAQLAELRAIFAAINTGETTWEAVVEAREAPAEDKAGQAVKSQVDSILAKQREKIAQKAAGNGAPAAQPAAGQQPAGQQPPASKQPETKASEPAARPAQIEPASAPPPKSDAPPSQPSVAPAEQPSVRAKVFIEWLASAESTDDISAIRRDLDDVIGGWGDSDKAAVMAAQEAALARLRNTK